MGQPLSALSPVFQKGDITREIKKKKTCLWGSDKPQLGQ